MTKTIIPKDEIQLQEWIEKLVELELSYEVSEFRGHKILTVDETTVPILIPPNPKKKGRMEFLVVMGLLIGFFFFVVAIAPGTHQEAKPAGEKQKLVMHWQRIIGANKQALISALGPITHEDIGADAEYLSFGQFSVHLRDGIAYYFEANEIKAIPGQELNVIGMPNSKPYWSNSVVKKWNINNCEVIYMPEMDFLSVKKLR